MQQQHQFTNGTNKNAVKNNLSYNNLDAPNKI